MAARLPPWSGGPMQAFTGRPISPEWRLDPASVAPEHVGQREESTMRHLPDPMQWLAARLPLTLLIDLLDPAGPPSARIFEAEPAELEWLPSAAA